jgi:hypothetical protein
MMSHAVNKKAFSNGSKSVENFFLQTNKIQEHLKLFELNECIS